MTAWRALWRLWTSSTLWVVLAATLWVWLFCGLLSLVTGLLVVPATERCGVAGLSTSCGSVARSPSTR